MCKLTAKKKMGISATKKRMQLKFADPLIATTHEVPRLDDAEIDDLFYQEDEIGEMRYFSFMVECGIEEDPPDDGPDVKPVPWLVSQLSKDEQDKLLGGKQTEEKKEGEKEKEEEEYFDLEEKDVKLKSDYGDDGATTTNGRPKPPRRMRSMDHMVQKFNNNNAAQSDGDEETPARPPPRRVRPAPNARRAPKRSPSMGKMLAKFENSKNNGAGGGADTTTAIPSAYRSAAAPSRGGSRRAPPSRGKLACTRSGSDLNDMKDMLKKNRRQQRGRGQGEEEASQNDDVEEDRKKKAPTSPTKPFRAVRGKLKLTAAKSGSLHHMRTTLNRNRGGGKSPPKRTDGRRGSGVFQGINKIITDERSNKKNDDDPTLGSSEDTIDSDEESSSSEDVSIESD